MRIRNTSGSRLLCGAPLAYLALDPLASTFALFTTKDTLLSTFAVLAAVLLCSYLTSKSYRSIEDLAAIALTGAIDT